MGPRKRPRQPPPDAAFRADMTGAFREWIAAKDAAGTAKLSGMAEPFAGLGRTLLANLLAGRLLSEWLYFSTLRHERGAEALTEFDYCEIVARSGHEPECDADAHALIRLHLAEVRVGRVLGNFTKCYRPTKATAVAVREAAMDAAAMGPPEPPAPPDITLGRINEAAAILFETDRI